MELHHLIKMANEIGGFFAQMPEREEAVAAIAGHLRNFWEPRMRRELIEYAQRDGAELKELVRAAVLSLPVPPEGDGTALNESIIERETLKWRGRGGGLEADRLAVEEPLEIRLGGRRFTLTMRTPGHDEELAAGFLLAEGFVGSRAELGEIRRVRGAKGAPDPNVLDIILTVPATKLRERLKRNFTISSSCGVCGKTSIESLQRRIEPIVSRMRLTGATVLCLPALMREAQAVFAATGGLHAAALFSLARDSGDGVTLAVLREDVGRHNAVDKVIGYALMHDLIPLDEAAILVSGRLSFEIVQKTAAAGVPILCAVSAPSSLAVELAEEAGMTLVGFVRADGFNVYTHRERILV